MTILIKVTESKEAPPTAGSGYKHYLAGNVYGPDTDPPATLALVRRALAEGWAIPWPPEEAKVEPEVEVGDIADALRLLGVPDIRIAQALADPGDVQTCDDCGLTTDDPDVMFYHACVVEAPPGVDLAPFIETLPPLDPLLAALGPLPEGVHTVTGEWMGKWPTDQELGLSDEPGPVVTVSIDAKPLTDAIDRVRSSIEDLNVAAQAAGQPLMVEIKRLPTVTDLQGNPIPRGPDGLIHGEPLRGLTDDQRAALPELLPQDADAPSELGISTADYPPVEPIAVFDASDAIHAAPQEAPVEQAPDVPPTPAEAPKPATGKVSKTRKPATSRKR